MSYDISKTLETTPEQAVENPELDEVAIEIKTRLQRVIDAL